MRALAENLVALWLGGTRWRMRSLISRQRRGSDLCPVLQLRDLDLNLNLKQSRVPGPNPLPGWESRHLKKRTLSLFHFQAAVQSTSQRFHAILLLQSHSNARETARCLWGRCLSPPRNQSLRCLRPNIISGLIMTSKTRDRVKKQKYFSPENKTKKWYPRLRLWWQQRWQWSKQEAECEEDKERVSVRKLLQLQHCGASLWRLPDHVDTCPVFICLCQP